MISIITGDILFKENEMVEDCVTGFGYTSNIVSGAASNRSKEVVNLTISEPSDEISDEELQTAFTFQA